MLADATATLGLLESSRAELISQQEELDADDIESRAEASQSRLAPQNFPPLPMARCCARKPTTKDSWQG